MKKFIRRLVNTRPDDWEGVVGGPTVEVELNDDEEDAEVNEEEGRDALVVIEVDSELFNWFSIVINVGETSDRVKPAIHCATTLIR